MKAARLFTLMVAVPLLLQQGASGQTCPPEPMGTAFTYQGLLTCTIGQQTPLVNATCDFDFTLWDCQDAGTGTLIATPTVLDLNDPTATLCTAPLCPVTVIDGHFTVQLDGGNVYPGAARFLQITVSCPNPCPSGAQPLEPRQELTPVPYAIFAGKGPGPVDDKDWSGSGSGKMYATNLTDNVGIGTDDPNAPLSLGLNQLNFDPFDLNASYNWAGPLTRGTIKGLGSIVIDFDNNADSPDQIFAISHSDGTEVFRINKSGKVGIGTTSPDAVLHAAGASSAIGTPIAVIESSGLQIPIAFHQNGVEMARIRSDLNGNLTLATVSTVLGAPKNINLRAGGDTTAQTDLFIEGTTGNVGIGMNAANPPTAKLDVDGQIRIRGGGPADGLVLTSDVDGVGTWLAPAGGIGGSGTTNFVSKFTAPTTLGNSLIFDNGTNVGIGTTSPTVKLDVDGKIHASDTITSGSSITIDGNATPNTINSDNADALELHVASGRALRLEPANGPNLIGGSSANSVTSGAVGGTIAGGGNTGFPNRVTDDYGTVGGGLQNRAGNGTGATNDAKFATVGGGESNIASANHATVGGGSDNTASGQASTVGGGRQNIASGGGSTVAGGGESNTASGPVSTIGGGQNNTANGPNSTVGGGKSNTASGIESTVAGGAFNTASGIESTVGSGFFNTASGFRATVPGGADNLAGGDYSFAAGRRAQANHDGTFVWSDSTAVFADPFTSTGPNQFLIRAAGGVGIGTNSPSNQLSVVGHADFSGKVGIGVNPAPFPDILSVVGNVFVAGNITATNTITASFCCPSDRRLKDHIKPIAGALDKLTCLRGVSFQWRRDEFPKRNFRDGQQIGLIAQEVAEVLPEVVVTNRDGYKGIQYGKVVAVLVEAIKEQQQMINSTRSELGELKQRLAAVERAVGVEAKVQRANSAGLGGALAAAALALAALVGFVRHARTRKVGAR